VAGTDVEMVQQTDYPRSGKVALTVNPRQPKKFSLSIRIPNRKTSDLYAPTPEVSGLTSLAVNGKSVKPRIVKGYAVITREWKTGDRVELELPLVPQRIKADERIEADRGRVALRYGPLIYNVERADQADLSQPMGAGPLTAKWRGDLLGGIMTLNGSWADGTPLVAIPNFARMNRLGQQAEAREAAGDTGINYAPGATVTGATNAPNAQPGGRRRAGIAGVQSQVWIKDQERK
jgi:uncharacterized protein